MIILDTNVVSEPMRPELDARVLVWLADQDVGTLFITAVTEAELRTGFAIMPEGRRRGALGAALEAVLVEDFAGRVLPFEGARQPEPMRPSTQPGEPRGGLPAWPTP